MKAKASIRETIMWTAGCIAFLVGIGLTIGGFFTPPHGSIDGSVLTALGELLTFFGAIFGISGFTTVQIKKLERYGEEHD